MGEENLTNEAVVETSNEDLEVLKAELEKQKAETERFKASVNKLTAEAAERKRAERAKMGEEERIKAEREDEFNRLKEQAEADARELTLYKAKAAYKGIDDETVEKLITSVNEKDHASLAAAINKIVDKAVKDKEAEWKKSRPGAFVGDGSFSTMTKEEIMAIQDPIERQKVIAENIHLFS